MSDDPSSVDTTDAGIYEPPSGPEVVSLPRCDSLPPRPFSRSALVHISKRCARAWQVCPVDFNPKLRLLLVAVHDAKQAEVMRKRFEFLLRPVEISFTLTSREEIQRSILRYYEGKQIESAVARSKSTVRRGKADSLRPAPPALFDGGRPKLNIPRRRVSGQERDYRVGFSRSLDSILSAINPMVEHELRAEPEALGAIRLMAWRWRQFSRRMGLTANSVDVGALMIWLSPLAGNPALLARIRLPFEWSRLLWVNAAPSDAEGAEVVNLLRLIDAFTTMAIEAPEAVADPLYVRSELAARVEGVDDHSLRAMADLVGEGLLNPPIELSTSILLVDPAVQAGDELVTELARAGLSVSSLPVMESALTMLSLHRFDVVICAADQLGSSGDALCRAIRERQDGDSPIIFMMTSSRNDSALALRSGADEVLELPMTPDLLWVKLQRALDNRAARPDNLSGSFARVSFTDTIQILCASGRDSVISVEGPDENGVIYIKSGAVIHAERGELQGVEAFFEIMRWQGGTFTTEDLTQSVKQTIDVPVMTLLMEGSRRADEVSGDAS